MTLTGLSCISTSGRRLLESRLAQSRVNEKRQNNLSNGLFIYCANIYIHYPFHFPLGFSSYHAVGDYIKYYIRAYLYYQLSPDNLYNNCDITFLTHPINFLSGRKKEHSQKSYMTFGRAFTDSFQPVQRESQSERRLL